MKILIAINKAYLRRMLTDELTKAGHSVIAATSNGVDALSLCKSWSPEVVVTDFLLPGLDGLQTLRSVKETDPQAELILMSSPTQKAVRLEASHLGVTNISDNTELLEVLKKGDT